MSDGISDANREHKKIIAFLAVGRDLRIMIQRNTDPVFGFNEAFIDVVNDELRICGFKLVPRD